MSKCLYDICIFYNEIEPPPSLLNNVKICKVGQWTSLNLYYESIIFCPVVQLCQLSKGCTQMICLFTKVIFNKFSSKNVEILKVHVI